MITFGPIAVLSPIIFFLLRHENKVPEKEKCFPVGIVEESEKVFIFDLEYNADDDVRKNCSQLIHHHQRIPDILGKHKDN
jgi:hypothetical protein